MNTALKAKYGLFSTISLVIGCVIGSGIFFKVDDILLAANGNILAGLLGWIIVGCSVVLGAVALAYYAQLLPSEGGLLKYTEYRYGKKLSFFVGWFYMTIYYPVLGAVLFTVSGIYICSLIQEFYTFTPSFMHYTIAGFIALFILYFVNIKSPKTGGIIQNLSTVLKVIPLILIAFIGVLTIVQGNVATENTLHYAATSTNTSSIFTLASATFIPIAFAFDGWYVATQISGEVKNAKKNLPIALITGTTLVMFIYIFYYLGIVYKTGGTTIIQQGDAYITTYARNIANNLGAILMQVAIIISVLGAANAILIAGIRVPYQLVNSGSAKSFLQVTKINPKNNIPTNSAYLMLVLICIATLLFYYTNTNQFFIDLKFDLSSMPVTFVYVINLLLYLGLFKLINNNTITGNKLFKYAISIIAILGASIVLIGGIIASNGIIYIAISTSILAVGTIFYKK